MALVNICHGCLAVDRKLTPLKEYVTLYHQLLLKKSKDKTKSIQMCWECHRILSNVHTFRMKITHAQRLLNNNSWTNNPLSNLSKSHTVNDYEILIYEDEKSYTVPMEVDVEIKHENNDHESSSVMIEVESEVAITAFKKELKEEDFGDKNDLFVVRNSFDDIDDKNDVFDDIDAKDEYKAGDIFVPKKLLKKGKGKVKVQARRKRGPLKQKYRTVVIADIVDKRKCYDVEKIDQKTLEMWMEKKKKKTIKKNFQCSLCYSGFKQQTQYDRHVTVRHNKNHKYICDTCSFRFPKLERLRRHINDHYVQFVCRLCAQAFPRRDQLYVHLIHGPHSKQLECTKCGVRFDCNKSKDFFAHYRTMHGNKICDYCGNGFISKRNLAHHIKIRHTEIVCKICSIKLSSYDSLRRHNERKHVIDESERNYCVECDVQFINSHVYKEHISRSTKHIIKPRIPCPECDRTYAKRSYMMNHYNLEHSKECKNICPVCYRRFLTGHRLRCHMKYTHEKQPKPKNHMCIYCGRGFHTRRILENHIRTHTGERPFACEHCTAAFTQKQALTAHMRSAHK